MSDIAALVGELGDIPVETDQALVRQKSRDFFWYSPVLKRQLDKLTAEAVVRPRDEAELARVLSASSDGASP
jgi:FAD/FMN-containing dehydrogenase